MTPWHFGIGIACKAVGGPRVGFTAFIVSNVCIDAEVVYRILHRLPNPHGLSHTIPGALVVAGAATGITAPVMRALGRILPFLGGGDHPWRSAAAGAFLGTLSHVVLDAIMHHDARPLWPTSDANPLLGLMNIHDLHELCFWSGAIGLIAWAATAAWRKGRRKTTTPAI